MGALTCHACDARPATVGAFCAECHEDVCLHLPEGVEFDTELFPAERLCVACETLLGTDLPGWGVCAGCRQHETRIASLARLGTFSVPARDRDVGVVDRLVWRAS